MKKILTALAASAILFGISSCQVYDQKDNSILYSAMPTDGVIKKEDLTKKIEQAGDNTTDLVKIAKELSEKYTGKQLNDAGEEIDAYKTPGDMRQDILDLWDAEYPVQWDFTRK